MALFLIRYGEIGLKSKAVRRRFESALKRNITTRFIERKMECRIEVEWGRIFLWSDEIQKTKEILKKIFGIVSFSQALECSSNKEDICKVAIDMSKPFFKEGMSFRIKARRTGEHGYTSMDLGRDVGSAVFLANEELNPRVDLKNPDLTIFVEVRQKRAFVFSDIVTGPGGMPLGTQGRVLGLALNEKDLVACWLMMKRGCRVIIAAENEAPTSMMEPWDHKLRIVQTVELPEIENLANGLGAEGIALGWDLETFEKESVKITGLSIPLFYPLIGMTSGQVEDLLKIIKA
jgi:thiamine biosynthesis protein ThiI